MSRILEGIFSTFILDNALKRQHRARSNFIYEQHSENSLFKHTKKLFTKKLKIFRQKKSNIVHISAQIIDCGYSLEPSRKHAYIILTQLNPSFI